LLEPNYAKIASARPVTAAFDRADILTVLSTRLLLFDVSVAHCCANAHVAKALTTAGSAPACREENLQVRSVEARIFDFAPLVVESHGRLCAASHALFGVEN
jgi:hypothetical protein